MPRLKEFEPEEALLKAVYVFWEKGYSNTSIEDLVNHTGVSRKGLYTTFGNKHALFMQSLKHYYHKMSDNLQRCLRTDDSSVDTIRTYFLQFKKMHHSTEGKIGCFICNTAQELALEDEEVREWLQSYWQRLETLFAQALRNSVTSGQLPEDFDINKHASYYVCIVQGLANLARAQTPKSRLDNYIDMSLALLEPAKLAS